MIKTISQNDFINAFDQMGRNTHWSINGLEALYDFLIESEDSNDPMELDVIGLDCEFTEYKTALEAIKDYNGGLMNPMRKMKMMQENILETTPC